jgi:lipid-A-disaccharide synthase
MRVALVAGEASGDLLGAGLIRALKRRHPDATFEGMAGPAMRAEGCVAHWPHDALAVMGIFEVLAQLPRLLALRREIVAQLLADPPDLFIGIDSPDFTLGLERRLRDAGVPTVHYVSPTVWAWRPGRVAGIAAAADRVLCLFPFEPAYYDGQPTRALFVGHPAADALQPVADRGAARRALGLPGDGLLLAVLPGSRAGELARLGAGFAGALAALAQAHPTLRVAAPMVDARRADEFRSALARDAPGVEVTLLEGRSRELLAAADVALVASGTATLETMLVGTPMVVGYRLAPVTHWFLHAFGLVEAGRRYALPNILAEREVVPELMQGDCTAPKLAAALEALLSDADARAAQRRAFDALRAQLAVGADERAAAAVDSLLADRAARGAAPDGAR